MTIKIITTSQAPDAKPVGVSKFINTEWTILIEVPRYEIPEETFGGGTIIVPGVAEIITPLILTNTTSASLTVDIRIHRQLDGIDYLIATQLPVPGYDILPLPLNGQFIASGDRLEISSNSSSGIVATISFTVGQAEQDDIDGIIEERVVTP